MQCVLVCCFVLFLFIQMLISWNLAHVFKRLLNNVAAANSEIEEDTSLTCIALQVWQQPHHHMMFIYIT